MDTRVMSGVRDIALYRRRNPEDARGYLHAVCITVSLLVLVVGCSHEVVVPQTLTGMWKTSAPGYVDRYMKFTKDTLIYGIGEGAEIAHWINKIDSKKLDRTTTTYTFYYRDAEGDEAFLSITYRPDAGGTIQIKHDSKIWRRAAQ